MFVMFPRQSLEQKKTLHLGVILSYMLISREEREGIIMLIL